MKIRPFVLLGICSAFLMGNAFAGEGLFSRLYTTETVPGGHYEFEQLARSRTGRSMGRYTAFDFSTEFEYGVTDQLQAALYVNTGHISATGAPDDDDPNGKTGFTRDKFFVDGVSLEFIYRVLSPVSDPIGLAFYFEPGVMFNDRHNGLAYDKTFETEYKILLQKNFFEDQLIIAYNFVLETEFIRFKGEDSWKGELDYNNELGGSYRVAANWYAGLEIRNHNEIGNFKTHEHSVIWVGPAIHYGGPKVWATLGVLKQVYGSPNGVDGNGTPIGNGKFLRSHEDLEVTAKVGFPF